MNHTENGNIAIGAPNSLMRWLTDMPEPKQEPRVSYNVRTSTPWGEAQVAYYYAWGIVRYNTAGHGGFHVSAGLLRKMAEDMRGDAYSPLGWFEEDCAWCLVVLSFPDKFSKQARLYAVDTAKSYYPQQFARLAQKSY